MPGMGPRPTADDPEAGGEGLAGTAIVDVLGMKHLEARLCHGCGRVPRLIRGKPGGTDPLNALRMGKTTALGVRVNVDFNLADTGRELLVERRMPVLQADRGIRPL